jgi:hypothetical protein
MEMPEATASPSYNEAISANFAAPTTTANATKELDNISASFGLTDKIPIFSYLIISERVSWYRTIMRFFLLQHQELYKYQLTALEVWEAVRDQFDATYTLEKCQNDLKALEEWGNLITTHDASRHTTIQSFRTPALLYQATPLAIAIEIFLQEQRRIGSALGSLRQGDLARLWEIFENLEKLLAEIQPITTTTTNTNTQSTTITPLINSSSNTTSSSSSSSSGGSGRTLEIAEEWRRAFELFSSMAREAAQYLANLTNESRRPRASLEAYQYYKRAVVEYVTNFGQTLSHYSPAFRERLTAWQNEGRTILLAEAIAVHLQPPTSMEEAHRQSPAQLAREAANQVGAVAGWFASGSNADTFRRAAMGEVEKVVRRAEQFAATARPNANYANDLDALARRLMEAVDVEESRQLTLVAFAHAFTRTPIRKPDWSKCQYRLAIGLARPTYCYPSPTGTWACST